MSFATAVETPPAQYGAMLMAIAAAEGSASHPWLISCELNAGGHATRNLADALRLLSQLHGGYPGLIELAGEHNVLRAADLWLAEAAAGFAVERAFLAQLTVIAGPCPSTPGEVDTVATVLGQVHALETIGRSERFGCALGAVAALVLDWLAIRAVLETGAARMGIKVPHCILPDEATTCDILAAIPHQARLDRTLAFGARQLLIQHSGLWDLAEARADARAANEAA